MLNILKIRKPNTLIKSAKKQRDDLILSVRIIKENCCFFFFLDIQTYKDFIWLLLVKNSYWYVSWIFLRIFFLHCKEDGVSEEKRQKEKWKGYRTRTGQQSAEAPSCQEQGLGHTHHNWVDSCFVMNSQVKHLFFKSK